MIQSVFLQFYSDVNITKFLGRGWGPVINFCLQSQHCTKKRRIKDETELSAVHLLIFLLRMTRLLNYKKNKANKPNKANLCLSHVINFPNSLYFTQWKALLSSKAKRFCSLKLWDECFTFMIQQNTFFQKFF